jgi:hypothetical protein
MGAVDEEKNFSQQYQHDLHLALQIATMTLWQIMQSPYPKSAQMAEAGLNKVHELFGQHFGHTNASTENLES